MSWLENPFIQMLLFIAVGSLIAVALFYAAIYFEILSGIKRRLRLTELVFTKYRVKLILATGETIYYNVSYAQEERDVLCHMKNAKRVRVGSITYVVDSLVGYEVEALTDDKISIYVPYEKRYDYSYCHDKTFLRYQSIRNTYEHCQSKYLFNNRKEILKDSWRFF